MNVLGAVNRSCPNCRHEVLPKHFDESQMDDEQSDYVTEQVESSPSDWISEHFSCMKCGHKECTVQEVAMTGGGISKLLDIQYNHYLFATCEECGFVEVYDADVLYKRQKGFASSIVDLML